MSRRVLDTDMLVGIKEIADLCAVSSQAVCNWVVRYHDFPEPVVSLRSGRVYYWPDISAWLRQKHRPF